MRIIGVLLVAAVSLIASPSCALSEAEKSQASAEVKKAITSEGIKRESSKPAIKTNATGLQWLQMSGGDRLECLIASMVILTNYGVRLERSPNDYYDVVGDKLRLNSSYYSANVTNILASIVYEQEPGNREALDRTRKK